MEINYEPSSTKLTFITHLLLDLRGYGWLELFYRDCLFFSFVFGKFFSQLYSSY